MARYQGDARTDPRELDPEFRKLPEDVRDEVRAGWSEDDAFFEKKRYALRPLAEQAGLFLAVHVLCFGFTFIGLLVALLSGCFSGWVADRFGDNELLAGPLAAACWALGLAFLPSNVLTSFALAAVSSVFLIAFLAALMARERACRSSGMV